MVILTQREAAQRGLNKFYTGKQCKHGHDSERWTISGECVQCNVERVYRRRKEMAQLLRAAQEVN